VGVAPPTVHEGRLGQRAVALFRAHRRLTPLVEGCCFDPRLLAPEPTKGGLKVDEERKRESRALGPGSGMGAGGGGDWQAHLRRAWARSPAPPGTTAGPRRGALADRGRAGVIARADVYG